MTREQNLAEYLINLFTNDLRFDSSLNQYSDDGYVCCPDSNACVHIPGMVDDIMRIIDGTDRNTRDSTET